MKVYAYKLHANTGKVDSIEVVFKKISADALPERIVELHNNLKLRVELIQKDDNGLWLMNFVRFRETTGPGKAHPERKLRGFSFKEQECFGEDTAALYNPKNGYFVVQYNHFGPRSAAIAEYLSMYIPGHDYKLQPKMDEDTELKFKTKSIFKKIEFSIAPGAITKLAKKRGVSLEKALDLSTEFGGESITVTINSGRSPKSTLFIQPVWNSVRELIGISGEDKFLVKKLEVTGRDTAAHPSEIIDFLGQRLGLEYEITPDDTLRLPVQMRWDCLLSAHHEWEELLL